MLGTEYQSEYLVSIGERPWGVYVVLANEVDIKVKRITVRSGHRLSLQRHSKREEHWFIHKGLALVEKDGQKYELSAGEAVDIPRGIKHRISNIGEGELVFVEIQTGDYFGEDDIERFEDDYVRVNNIDNNDKLFLPKDGAENGV